MNNNDKREYAGVCMDTATAEIICSNKEAENREFSIQHTIKSAEAHTGGSEHSMNNAQHTNELKYFKSVAAQLMPYDEILIFGTGKAQEQFQNYLKDDAQFSHKKISIDSAQHLTDPQKIAMVRDFFKGKQ